MQVCGRRRRIEPADGLARGVPRDSLSAGLAAVHILSTRRRPRTVEEDSRPLRTVSRISAEPQVRDLFGVEHEWRLM